MDVTNCGYVQKIYRVVWNKRLHMREGKGYRLLIKLGVEKMLERRIRSLERKLKTMDGGMKEEREVLKLYALLNERLDLTEVNISPNTRRGIEYLTLGDILI